MKEETVHFRDLVPVDITRLDEEWLAHPILFHDLAEAVENASYENEVAKDELDRVEAELSLDIREDPEKYGAPANKQGGISEGTITSTIRVQAKYQQAKEAARKAEHILGHLKKDLRVMEHRKSAMEELVKLHGQHYFSMPRSEERVPTSPNVPELRSKYRVAIIQERRRKVQEKADGKAE
jgi:hypothetical protein